MTLRHRHFEILINAAVLVVLFLPGSGLADIFYIQSGKNLVRTDNQDPDTVLAKYWTVRLYRTGAEKNGENYWGCELADSAAEVMAQLESDQKTQRWAERSCDCSWDPLTYFNFLGPIAVIAETDSAKQDESHLETLLGQGERLQDLKDEYELIQEIVDEQPKEKNPFAGVGNVLKQYTDNLKSAVQLQTRLKGSLTNFAQQETKTFDQSLTELSTYEDLCEKAIPGLQQVIDAFAPTPEPTPTPDVGSSGSGFDIQLGPKLQCFPGPCP